MSDGKAVEQRKSGGGFDRRRRDARLGSGLVLTVFVAMHIANHALLLVSLDAAEAARHWFLLLWRNPLGTVVLYGSALVHFALTMHVVYRRRTLLMPAREAFQIALGLAIPLVLAEHVMGTRVYHALSGNDDTYEWVTHVLWVYSPQVGLRQSIATLIIWAHACLGIYFWLRFRPWFPRWAPLMLIASVLLPVLGLLGFVVAGRQVQLTDPAPSSVPPDLAASALATTYYLLDVTYVVFGTILLAVLLARAVRLRRERSRLIEVRYGDGHVVRVAKGYSVLEASRIGGIPHNSVCGGKGRCSTCRVRVTQGADKQPPPNQIEEATLKRIGAEPDVRLACQLRPVANLSVTPLLVADKLRAAAGGRQATPGREQDVAILFCDIRGFTALSDRRLPFDVVFLLNRYFSLVGTVVEKAGGRLDKFVGDGAMAIFGLEVERDEACRQAVTAAAGIVAGLEAVSRELAAELPAPMRVAIGIHAGRAIVGSMGFGSVMSVTAIGDTVNTASRLEAVAKELNAAIVISERAASVSGFDFSGYELQRIDIRGVSRPLDIRVVPTGAPLPAKTQANAAA
jgi:adenylate cyclase